jgi:hypothetical protein
MPNYAREISRTFDAGLTPRLDIRTVSGSVEVRGEDRSDIRICLKARFRASTDEEAAQLIRAIEDGLSVEGDRVGVHSPDADGGSVFGTLRQVFGHGRHLEIDVEVVAPRGCSLALRLVNGPATVTRVGGNTRVHMVNGRFEVADVGGDLTVHHVNGRGAIRNVAGSVEMHYTNGALEIDRAGGDVNLHLVNGRVEIRDPGGDVSVRGVSGSFELTGAIRGDVKVSNSHGRITLNVPGDSRFKLDARSAIGTVSSEFDVRDTADVQGDAPHVDLRSETGRIELRALREAQPAGV